MNRPSLLNTSLDAGQAQSDAEEPGRPQRRPAAEDEPPPDSRRQETPVSDHPPQVIVRPVAVLRKSSDLTSAKVPIVTERFILSSTKGDVVSTSESGEAQTVYRCEDEPIHIPGAIQQFGALVALREQKDGSFLVCIASENSQRVVGHAPKDLFELRCLTDLLPHRAREDFIARVRAMRSLPEETKPKSKPDIFSLSLTSLMGAPNPTWCALHLIRDVDLVVCEFELQSDVFNPIAQAEEGFPDEPVHILGNHSTDEARLLSTTKRSAPLHALQFAREKGDQLDPMVMFQALCEIQSQLAAATTLPNILDVIVGLISELTGFHRVMVYKFDQNASGSIVSELVKERASADIFRGLHFPASDIPKQARDLYMINTIRILHDRDQETARLVCRTLEDAAKPLDLTHSYLRAMSPVHLKYLKNMGVQASMSLSLPVNDELWGLVSCHGYGSGMRVSPPLRELCRSLGDLAGAHIEKLIYASRLQARRPLSTPPLQRTPSAYISASSADLLNLFDADFGLLTIKDEARSVGRLTAYDEAIALLQYVRLQAFISIVTSSNIKNDFPDLSYSPGFSTIAGFLVIPLAMAGSDFLVLFRKGQLKEVSWAGNPYEKIMREGTEYLEPRASFQRWSEHVIGTSREWTQDQGFIPDILGLLRFLCTDGY